MRQFRIALALAVLGSLVSVVAFAQQTGRIYRIGILLVGTPNYEFADYNVRAGGFEDGLRQLGYTFGHNLLVEERTARGETARLATEAAALVASNVDVIVTDGNAPTLAAMRATNRIPIVFLSAVDPVGTKLVASLARPEGNVTGMATKVAQGKSYQLLREAFPMGRRVAVLRHAQDLPSAAQVAAERADAAAVGFELVYVDLQGTENVEARLGELARTGVAAVVVAIGDGLGQHRSHILHAALRQGLGTVCDTLGMAINGCLMTYAELPYDRTRRAATIVDRVLKGARPADIPVELPSKFRLVINAATAKALGLAIPASLMGLADEVLD